MSEIVNSSQLVSLFVLVLNDPDRRYSGASDWNNASN